jgi:hypothetical protein
MKIFFLLALISCSVAHASEGIKIVSAKWGKKDVTRDAATFCDGHVNCDYKISEKYIGPARGAKTFTMDWRCNRKSQPIEKIPANAEGKIIRLNCDVQEVEETQDVQVTQNDSAPQQDLDISINTETIAYYKKLLIDYKLNPLSVRLESFTKTFFPETPAPKGQSDRLVDCGKTPYQSDCTPDTYYSWGPAQKLENIYNATLMSSWGRSSLNKRSIYMNQSSIGSYCYGKYPVRFKFSTPPKRGFLNNGDFQKTFNEWTVNSPDEGIESVSYAQPEHLDEMIIEIKRRLVRGSDWSNAALYKLYPPYEYRKSIYTGCVPEVLALNEDNLVNNIMSLLDAYFSGKGWIHSPRCEKDCKAESEDHFKTKWPTFYNPN